MAQSILGNTLWQWRPSWLCSNEQNREAHICIRISAEYTRGGVVFCAHPNYRKKGPWCDWAMFRKSCVPHGRLFVVVHSLYHLDLLCIAKADLSVCLLHHCLLLSWLVVWYCRRSLLVLYFFYAKSRTKMEYLACFDALFTLRAEKSNCKQERNTWEHRSFLILSICNWRYSQYQEEQLQALQARERNTDRSFLILSKFENAPSGRQAGILHAACYVFI
jgi:hypothetical protein